MDHYFGEITSKEPRPNSPAAATASGRNYYFVYSIKFDDGDLSGDPLRPRYISHENNAPLAERAKLQKATQEKPKATKKRGRPTKGNHQRNGSVPGTTTTTTSSTSSSNDVKQEANGKHGAQEEEKTVNASGIIQAKLLSMESKRCLTCHECTAPKCGRCFFCRNEETNRLGLCFSKVCTYLHSYYGFSAKHPFLCKQCSPFVFITRCFSIRVLLSRSAVPFAVLRDDSRPLRHCQMIWSLQLRAGNLSL